jgi:hypothetical protein
MIRLRLVVIAAVSILSAQAAFAGPGIDLSFNGCPGNPGAVGGYVAPDGGGGVGPDIDCASGGPIVLIGTWSTDESIPDLVGLDGSIDYQAVGGLDARPFWNFESGACNETALSSSQVRAQGCSSPVPYRNTWGATGSGSAWLGQRTSADAGRIAFVVYRPFGLAMTAGDLLFGMQIIVDGSTSTEAGGTCAGCCGETDVVWNSATPMSISAVVHTTLVSSTGNFPNFSNGLVLRGGSASCGPVPVRPRTWGALKSLYR